MVGLLPAPAVPSSASIMCIELALPFDLLLAAVSAAAAAVVTAPSPPEPRIRRSFSVKLGRFLPRSPLLAPPPADSLFLTVSSMAAAAAEDDPPPTEQQLDDFLRPVDELDL